jgi:hypothetical protein
MKDHFVERRKRKDRFAARRKTLSVEKETTSFSEAIFQRSGLTAKRSYSEAIFQRSGLAAKRSFIN